MYRIILQQCTPELEKNMKGMHTYDVVETDQDGIEITKMIWTICHTQDYYKQEVRDAVETNKKLYLFYQVPFQTNKDQLEASKAYLKVNEAHNVTVGYQMVIAEIELQEKHNTTSNTTNKEQNIQSGIKARERYVMCMFLRGLENLR